MKLVVCPASRAEAAVAQYAPSHVITLLSPGATAPGPTLLGQGRRLDLRFHDIAESRAGLVAPTRDMVERLLAFGERWPAEAPLLVHCYAGISRSTAAAFVIACARGSPGDETRLAATLRARSPSATPNPRIVALADGLLGREGRMTDAVAALGRGADAFEGETFELSVQHGSPSS